MKKIFLNQNMTWKRVIIFSIITAVVTATLNEIKFLNGTSFQDIAINLDMWFLFAIYIVINCKNAKEAMMKTFIFFLISQPLIYLLEVPFEGFGVFRYYKYWFIITLLTIPGSFICYQLKKKNWLSVLVMAVPIIYYGYISSGYFWNVMSNFPNHLLSLIVCILISIFLTFILFDKKIHKIVLICVLVASLLFTLFIFKPIKEERVELYYAAWTYAVDDSSVVSVHVEDNIFVVFEAKKDGRSLVKLMDSFGVAKEYYVTVSNGSIFINEF